MKIEDRGTLDIHNGLDSRRSRNKLPFALHEKAARLLDRLEAAHDLRDLSAPGLRLEKLGGDREGQYSIRINDQYRICFNWGKAEAVNVEIIDYH